MLVPPVAQGATGGRPVADSGNRSQQTSGPAGTLWPLAPAQPNQPPSQQPQATPPLAATPAPAHNQGVSRYGLYSLFPGGGGGNYVAATPATPGPTSARAYHATTHKAVGVGVGGYTWGAPTPPPGSPYSPVPVTQLELLAKNLASLTPPVQQTLSLPGVGVNVGSLHHAQHTTQHTQHTLNLAGLHHLHHGGLHQSTFSPQLSLVTGNAPTLTINSFSSPTSTSNVVPTTGVLLQEYQSPAASVAACASSVSASSGPTSTNTSASAMVVQQGGIGAVQGQVAKKREAFLPSQGQPVKLENKARQPCLCRNSNGKTKAVHSDAGCSRTLPVASSWNGQDAASSAGNASLVKREPLASVPCQVAEVSTSLHATTTAVKIEPVPPKSENGIVVSNAGAGGIPVGIAVARQRLQHQETSSSMRNVSLSHHTSHHASYHHFQPDNLGPATAMTVGGATLVHCGAGGDERSAHLAFPSLNNALNSTLNSTLGSVGATAATAATGWPPTLWQYPTAAMPMEPVGFPQMGVGLQGGLQLVRDPTSGHLLLIHATEQMQQAVVWPNYPSHNGSSVGPPPLLLPPPPSSLQLLSDIGGTRLVLTDSKRKQQGNLPIVKIEADCSNSPTTIITSSESTKALQTVTSMTGTLVPDAPLVTTLHYYPHAPALVQINQAETTHCKSQATSPVSCLTPPPEVTTIHGIELPEAMPIGVQDASNQTDAPDADEELPAIEHVVKQEQTSSPCELSTTSMTSFEIVSSPETLGNVVRITNVSSSSACNVIGKVDKAENTVNSVADCARYSVKDSRTAATSVDRTIEHVVNGHADDEAQMPPEMSFGPKIIEITEENCDSFHENLEFFARRRDPLDRYRKSEEVAEKRHSEVFEVHSSQAKIEEPREASVPVETRPEVEAQSRANCENCCAKTHRSQPPVETTTLTTTTPPTTGQARLTVKPFDMPSIDGDEHVDKVVVKREKQEEDEKFAVECPYGQKVSSPLPCDVALQEQKQLVKEKIQDRGTESISRRHPSEKFHPGIENVVEKLKKNAAAAMQDHQSRKDTNEEFDGKGVSESLPPRPVDNAPRRLENGLKKLILRSCENSEPLGKRINVSESDRRPERQRSVGTVETSMVIHSPGKEIDRLLPSNDKYFHRDSERSDSSSEKDSSVARGYLNNNNNNINKNNNNHNDVEETRVPKQEKISDGGLVKLEESKSQVDLITIIKRDQATKTEVSGHDSFPQPTTPVGPKHAALEPGVTARPKTVVGSKQKPVVDLSGLELLSNSIEQLEHLKPEVQEIQSTSLDLEESPAKTKVLPAQGESNNNVDSPLGLLCALAEQRFMEEVGGDTRKTQVTSSDNSEEVSHAGRLLLNLGKASVAGERRPSEKRKNSADEYVGAKRLREDAIPRTTQHYCDKLGKARRYGEEATFRANEKIRRSIDFSERKGKAIREDDRGVPEVRTAECPYYEEEPLRSPPIESNDEKRPFEGYNGKYNFFKKRDERRYDGCVRKLELDVEEELSTDSETEDKPEDCNGKKRDARRPCEEGEAYDQNGILESSVADDVRDSYLESHHKYNGNTQVKAGAKKFNAKKTQEEGDADWPDMDAMELDMRVRLADIQRQYKEKQKELSRLTPKKDEKRSLAGVRKKSRSFSSECGAFPSSPTLEFVASTEKSPPRSPEGTPPPLTSAVLAMPRCNVNLVKLGEPRSHIKLLDSIPSIPIPVPPVASPITVLPVTGIVEDDDKTMIGAGYETSSPAPTVTSSSSASKKRKVGRPRKLMCASGSVRHLTETIVAKKPKSKSSLVGYLLNAKNKHLQNKFLSKTGYTPLPFKPGLSSSRSSSRNRKVSKSKAKPVKQTPLHNKSVISSIIAEKAKLSQEAKLEKQTHKVKPKLKAEAKVKTWDDEESTDWNGAADNIPVEAVAAEPEKATPVEQQTEKCEKEREKEKHEKSKKKKKRKSCSTSPKRRKSGEHERDGKESKRRKSSECKECKECAKVAKAERTESVINRCKLTSAHLAIDQLRVLTAMGGLFYAGRLSAIQAPDVYAITLDGERGNRPHIHSREEILRDAIVEVCPSSTKELPPGTRLCAYWSQQYRCLYPGTSVEPSEPDPELDEKFVSVEFDDGDSGRIALDDIRLLQPDYPVVEYDPNPLLTLGKRRRQTSTSVDDKRSSTGSQVVTTQSSGVTSTSTSAAVTSIASSAVVTSTTEIKSSEQQKSEDADTKTMDEYRERKRLKKRRRDKLKRLQEAQDGKKKHKRHKCCEEHRKHKHRKHRKHKHRHSHHSSHSESSHLSGGESCSGQKNEEEPAARDSAKAEEEEEEEQATKEHLEQNGNAEEEESTPEPAVEIIPKEKPDKVEKPEKPKKADKKAKARERQESVESRSKMAAFLPARQLWGWAGKGYRRPGAKGRAKKQFFKAIQRGSERIQIGDSAVFLSTGRPDRPYIGSIESMWETSSSNMIVKVKWFYHPEETVGCPTNLKYPGALFESPHMDENDVQTISHKCEVLPLAEYTEKLGKEPHRYLTIYDNNDIYYLAGYYDPTTYLLTMQPGVV